jgi:hypothetical protein
VVISTTGGTVSADRPEAITKSAKKVVKKVLEKRENPKIIAMFPIE